jgi:hypothetical protein
LAGETNSLVLYFAPEIGVVKNVAVDDCPNLSIWTGKGLLVSRRGWPARATYAHSDAISMSYALAGWTAMLYLSEHFFQRL